MRFFYVFILRLRWMYEQSVYHKVKWIEGLKFYFRHNIFWNNSATVLYNG